MNSPAHHAGLHLLLLVLGRRPPRPSRSASARRPCRGSATPCGRDGSTSSWSSFSPTDASLIGLPVTARTESAAPPRASPSSFVRTHAVEGDALLEGDRDVDRLLAGHRVEHEQDVVRLHLAVDRVRARPSAPRRSAGGRRCRRSRRRAPASAPARARAWPPRRDRSRSRARRPGSGSACRAARAGDRGRALQVGGDEQRALASPCAASARAWPRRSSCPSPGGRRAGSRSAAAREREPRVGRRP